MSSNRGRGKGHNSGGGTSIPAPTGFTATIVYTNNVYLKWDPVLNATAYWIYRNQYVPAIVQATNYTDVPGAPGTYTYAIAAVVNSTLGPKSTEVMVIIN